MEASSQGLSGQLRLAWKLVEAMLRTLGNKACVITGTAEYGRFQTPVLNTAYESAGS